MNVIREIFHLNSRELSLCLPLSSSWHKDFIASNNPSSHFIFIGGLDDELNEGDIITVFSQFGEVISLDLIRHPQTGKSRGFAFLGFADRFSTILSIDNFNGIQLGKKILRVDHADKYKKRIKNDSEENADFSEESAAAERIFSANSMKISSGQTVFQNTPKDIWDHKRFPIPLPNVSETLEKIRFFSENPFGDSSAATDLTETSGVSTQHKMGNLRAIMKGADNLLAEARNTQQIKEKTSASPSLPSSSSSPSPSPSPSPPPPPPPSSHLSHIAKILEMRKREMEEEERKEKLGGVRVPNNPINPILPSPPIENPLNFRGIKRGRGGEGGDDGNQSDSSSSSSMSSVSFSSSLLSLSGGDSDGEKKGKKDKKSKKHKKHKHNKDNKNHKDKKEKKEKQDKKEKKEKKEKKDKKEKKEDKPMDM